MARQLRIEYAGAVYHALARGDRREDIVLDAADRRRFEETLAEVIDRSGWLLFAWVLMGNHYHLLFKTPEPNLVEGMKWFQNTWTRRFNTRHQVWGHLFGGRYKAILVEEGGYLTRLMHYIHLNPVRAGLVKSRAGLRAYRWSSLPDYAAPPRKRRNWVAVERGLRHVELADTAAGRRQFLEWTETSVNWKEPREAGIAEVEDQGLQSTLRRGWYFGSETFREKLVEKLGRETGRLSERRRKGYGGEQTRDHGIAEAERIIREAERGLGIRSRDWASMKKGDWRKGFVAGLIRERALVDNGWLATRLHMGARNAVSRTIRLSADRIRTDRAIRKTAKRLTENVN